MHLNDETMCTKHWWIFVDLGWILVDLVLHFLKLAIWILVDIGGSWLILVDLVWIFVDLIGY